MSYIIMCQIKPAAAETQLLSISRKYVQLALGGGGIVRGIRNNGVRELAYPLRQSGDARAYRSAHGLTIELFCNPATLDKVTGDLRLDDRVLRYTALKAKGTLPRIPRPLRDAVARGELLPKVGQSP
jgi:ribosomal protein S6